MSTIRTSTFQLNGVINIEMFVHESEAIYYKKTTFYIPKTSRTQAIKNCLVRDLHQKQFYIIQRLKPIYFLFNQELNQNIFKVFIVSNQNKIYQFSNNTYYDHMHHVVKKSYSKEQRSHIIYTNIKPMIIEIRNNPNLCQLLKKYDIQKIRNIDRYSCFNHLPFPYHSSHSNNNNDIKNRSKITPLCTKFNEELYQNKNIKNIEMKAKLIVSKIYNGDFYCDICNEFHNNMYNEKPKKCLLCGNQWFWFCNDKYGRSKAICLKCSFYVQSIEINNFDMKKLKARKIYHDNQNNITYFGISNALYCVNHLFPNYISKDMFIKPKKKYTMSNINEYQPQNHYKSYKYVRINLLFFTLLDFGISLVANYGEPGICKIICDFIDNIWNHQIGIFKQLYDMFGSDPYVYDINPKKNVRKWHCGEFKYNWKAKSFEPSTCYLSYLPKPILKHIQSIENCKNYIQPSSQLFKVVQVTFFKYDATPDITQAIAFHNDGSKLRQSNCIQQLGIASKISFSLQNNYLQFDLLKQSKMLILVDGIASYPYKHSPHTSPKKPVYGIVCRSK